MLKGNKHLVLCVPRSNVMRIFYCSLYNRMLFMLIGSVLDREWHYRSAYSDHSFYVELYWHSQSTCKCYEVTCAFSMVRNGAAFISAARECSTPTPEVTLLFGSLSYPYFVWVGRWILVYFVPLKVISYLLIFAGSTQREWNFKGFQMTYWNTSWQLESPEDNLHQTALLCCQLISVQVWGCPEDMD